MTLNARVAFGLFFVAIFVWVILDAFLGYGQKSSRAALFPLAIGIPALGLAVLATVDDWRQTRRLSTRPSSGRDEAASTTEKLLAKVAQRRTFAILAWIVGFYLGIYLLGFMFTAPIAPLLYIRFAGKETWRMAVGGAVISWVFFNGLFQCFLGIPLEQRLGGKLTELLEEGLGIDINQYFIVPFLC
jgi:hypothetical protein